MSSLDLNATTPKMTVLCNLGLGFGRSGFMVSWRLGRLDALAPKPTDLEIPPSENPESNGVFLSRDHVEFSPWSSFPACGQQLMSITSVHYPLRHHSNHRTSLTVRIYRDSCVKAIGSDKPDPLSHTKNLGPPFESRVDVMA